MPPEPIGVLLLPVALEDFELAEHARDLLAIPRVIALEPGRMRTPRMLRDVAPFRQVKRLRFPGRPRVVVLYHPAQYPLARALCARYQDSELWYFRADPETLDPDPDYSSEELGDLDQLASERATDERVVSRQLDSDQMREQLRGRLLELGIISDRPFVPRGRLRRGLG